MAEHLCEYKYPKDCPVCSKIDPMAIDVEEEYGTQLAAAGLEERRAADLEARREQWRREALRAASRIVAGISPVQVSVAKYTFDLAERFTHWLETGER